MAFAHIKIKYDAGGNIRIPVTITNPANQKSVNLDILPDTGATTSAIDSKFARQMSLTVENGRPQVVNSMKGFYNHKLLLKIAPNLKPVLTDFVIGSGQYNLSVNVIGIPTMVLWENFRFWKGYVTVTEYADTTTTTQKKAAFGEAYKSFYGYQRWHRKRI